MKPIFAQQKPSVPGRHIVDGDVVYFRHEQHGPLSGRVVCVGKDGVTIAHETGDDGHHRVLWGDLLGHKERRQRRLTIVDRGEDGGIAVDEDGKRVFVEGELPEDESGYEPLVKSEDPDVPILVDLGNLHGASCDCALDSIYKALSDEDGIAHDIWAQHENPFIRDLIEKFTERGLTKIASVQKDLEKWLAGEFYVPSQTLYPIPAGFMGRWDQKEIDLVRLYLQSIPPGELSLDDWSLVIDYMVQRYLPLDALNEEAEWLSVKANLMGRVQAHMASITPEQAAHVAYALPPTVTEAGVMFKFSDVAESILSYGKARACDTIHSIPEAARHRLKRTILEYEQQKLSGAPVDTSTLQQQLLDQFDSLNRDWRRLAVTEAGEMANQGVVSSFDAGSKLRRIEMYNGACPWCKRIDGLICNVVDPHAPGKDGKKDVWAGKTNVGRSASPRKRVGGVLVDRSPEEMWHVASGVQHPHCRGRWEPMQAVQPGDDPEFADWLKKRLGQITVMPDE